MISESVVKNILRKDKLHQGVYMYLRILHLLHSKKVDVSSDAEFQGLYKVFYVTHFGQSRCKTFEDEYFQIFQDVKDDKDVTPREIYNRVCDITKSCEMSYASKMLHNLDTDVPIYDTVVGDAHFGFKRPPYSLDFESRKNKGWAKYEKYQDAFHKYVQSADGQKIVELFDAEFPNNTISSVKKVDFVLWQDANNAIIIPKEYKYHR